MTKNRCEFLKFPFYIFRVGLHQSFACLLLLSVFQFSLNEPPGRLSGGWIPGSSPHLENQPPDSLRSNPQVHQVSDWCSGAAAYFGWMREAKRENTRCGL